MTHRLERRLAVAAGVALLQGCSDATGPRPTALQLKIAPSATAQTMVPLAVQPVIQATGADGNAVSAAGIVITASVASGNGIVAAGATATTDASGTATFQKLTLGALNGSVGTVSLLFSGAGLPSVGASTALACAVKTILLSTPLSDSLVVGDCAVMATATRFKEYDFAVALPTKAVRITNTATFLSATHLRGPNEPLQFFGVAATALAPYAFKAFLPPGITRLLEKSVNGNVTGTFTLNVAATTEDDNNCEEARFHSPLSTNQTLAATCGGDAFYFNLPTAASITASISSAAFTPSIAIWRYSPNEKLVSQVGASNTASVSFTNTSSQAVICYVLAAGGSGTATGAYSVQATITNSTGALVAPSSEIDAEALMQLVSSLQRIGGRRDLPPR
jgi:hypothetical protein